MRTPTHISTHRDVRKSFVPVPVTFQILNGTGISPFFIFNLSARFIYYSNVYAAKSSKLKAAFNKKYIKVCTTNKSSVIEEKTNNIMLNNTEIMSE